MTQPLAGAPRRPAARRWRQVSAFAAAVLLATALGSVMQTQLNLAALQGLGVPVSMQVRLQATLHDLVNFTILYGVIVVVSIVPAFWVAGRVSRGSSPGRQFWFAAAGVVGLLTGFLAVDAFAPVPGFIAATRTATGTLAMAGTGAAGGWLYAWLTGRPA